MVRSRAGYVEVPVEVTDAIMPGVVSIPHGWGHGQDGMRTSVATAHPGVNSNLLADELLLDVPPGMPCSTASRVGAGAGVAVCGPSTAVRLSL